MKYNVKAVRQGPQSLRLHLGGAWVDVVVRQLNDGGLLVQVDGSSHVVHSEEEALGTRLTIDSFTCLLSNEHDPSQVLDKCVCVQRLRGWCWRMMTRRMGIGWASGGA